MILDLYDPKPGPEEDSSRPRLRVIPRGPRVSFSLPEDPETTWYVRLGAVIVGVVATGLGVGMILFTAANLKGFYERVDADDLARAQARARARAAQEAAVRPGPPGSINVSISAQPPKPPPPPPPQPSN